MRGKNILWLTLIALLLSVSVVHVRSQADTIIYADPSFVYGYLPGEVFSVDIMVADAVDLYSWSVEMSYAPYMSIMSVIEVIPGDFLAGRGPDYWFFATPYIDAFAGLLRIGATLRYDITGVDGYGWLATVRFTILEAGECALDLHDAIVTDSEQLIYEVATGDGYYLGPTADLIPPYLPTQRPIGGGHAQRDWKKSMVIRWGQPIEFNAEIVNTGYAPLYSRIRYTHVNEQTGETITMYAGQSYTSVPPPPPRTVYLYANEYTDLGLGWTMVGTSPYLNAEGDGSYIEADDYCQLSGIIGFEDVTLFPMEIITEVRLEAYTRSDAVDIDMDAMVFPVGAWLGSLWGESTWGWKSPRWMTNPVSQVWPDTTTKAGLNAFVAFVHYWTGDEVSHGIVDIDAMRLKVTIEKPSLFPVDPPFYVVDVGEVISPDPAIWYLVQLDTGKWYTTIAVEYMYYEPDPRFPQTWQTGLTTLTYEWWIKGEVET